MSHKPAPREMPAMTPAQRRANWWHYHWFWVLLGLAALLAAGRIAWDHLTRLAPDCSVAVVTRCALLPEEEAALLAALTAAAQDTNGDGQVLVALNLIPLQYNAAGLDEMSAALLATSLEKLNADFYTCQSGLFLLDDPAAFQAAHHALRYLDGSEPPETAADWQNMARPLAESPALAGLQLAGLNAKSLWLGRRIDGDGADFAGADALWQALYPD